MFINSLEQPKKAIEAIDALNGLELDVNQTIEVAKVHALLAIAEAIYESCDVIALVRAIDGAGSEIAMELSHR